MKRKENQTLISNFFPKKQKLEEKTSPVKSKPLPPPPPITISEKSQNNSDSLRKIHGKRNINKVSKPLFQDTVEENKEIVKSNSEQIILSDEQQEVFDAAVDGKSFFLTGNAGTGKSFILKQIIKKLKEIHGNDAVAVTAPTGIAAFNLEGCTIHSFSGIGIGTGDKFSIAKIVKKNKYKSQRWMDTRVLIIDEVSMLSTELFEIIENVARYVLEIDQSFGGIQVILCGDFHQLPPVIRESKINSIFCFESKLWKEVVPICFELKKQFRQSDPTFVNILNEIRIGKLSKEGKEELNKCINRTFEENDLLIEPTNIYPHKEKVNNENQQKLKSLKGEEMLYEAIDTGDGPFLDTLKKNCTAPEKLCLKLNSQVILLKNLSTEGGLVNGSRGVVVGFAYNNDPIVKFMKNQYTIEKQEFKISVGAVVKAKRVQYPLDLAWAISIHKSQGMTIEYVQTSLNSIFEYGQAYVALSRCKGLNGLRIIDEFIDVSKIRAHPKVLEFYDSLKKSTKFLKEVVEIKSEDDSIEEINLTPEKESNKSNNNQWVDEVKTDEKKEWIDVEDDNIIEIIDDIEENYHNNKSDANLKNMVVSASCINQKKSNPISNLYKSRKYLESDETPRLLMDFSFIERVNITMIEIKTFNDDSKPKSISIYINQLHLNFDRISKFHPVHEYNYQEKYEVHLENISNIVIYIKENNGNGSTKIEEINFYGKKSE